MALTALDFTADPAESPPRWRIAFGTRAGVVLGEPSDWRDLSLNLRLADSCDATLRVNGRCIQPGQTDELASDLWVWLADELVFRGRITGADDTLADDDHVVQLRATDYRGLLERRIIHDGDTVSFTGVDQAEIAWSLVNQTQAKPGGALGITRGLIPAGRPRDRLYEAGQKVGELLDNLSEVIDGFDYEVDPLLRLNVYYPRRGVDTPTVLDYGGSVSELERKSSSANFANVVRLAGAEDSTLPATRTAGDVATSPLGRWELAVQESDLKLQSTVDDRAARVLADRQSKPDQYDVTIAPGYWPLLGLRVGDTAVLVAESGRLHLYERVRITEIAFDIDENGGFRTRMATRRVP